MHSKSCFLAGFGEGFQKIVPIYVTRKNMLAPIPSAHDVINCAGVLNAQLARHGSLLPAAGYPVKQENELNKLWVTPDLLSDHFASL